MYSFSEDKDFSSKLKSFLSAGQYTPRRSGRTFLLLRCIIEQAIKTREIVQLIDHTDVFERFNRKPLSSIEHSLRDVLVWYRQQGVDIDVCHNNRRELQYQFRINHGHDIYQSLRIQDFDPTERLKVDVEKFNYRLLLLCQ